MNNALFQLTLPDSWNETTVFTFEGPNDSGVQHNLVVTVDRYLPKKAELVPWAQQQFGTSKEALPGFEMIQEREVKLGNGLSAYEIVYKYTPADTLTYFQKQTFFIADGKGYVFTGTYSKKTLKTIAHEVDQIIESFRPINPDMLEDL